MNIHLNDYHQGGDVPLIIYLDRTPREGHEFFTGGLEKNWFSHQLLMIDEMAAAHEIFERVAGGEISVDLLLISNNMWLRGGMELVSKIRAHPGMAEIPIYCVTSCLKKLNHPAPQCFNEQWRVETNCDEDERVTSAPFQAYMEMGHPARIDGTMCAHNVSVAAASILERMKEYWFNQPF